ncbi:MAG: hypothetical protein KDM64_03585 [Verrucomicrobiae bacterium]|nr:hypothetical protein [Verrucomicrobiae bacterium]
MEQPRQTPPDLPTSLDFGFPRFPTFVLAMAIIDLVLCLLRGLFGVIAAVRLAMSPDSVAHLPNYLAYPEMITAAAIGGVGTVANLLLILKKPAGIPLGWVNLALTIVSIAVILAELPLQLAIQPEGPQRIGLATGFIFTNGVRVILVIACGIALVMARRWFQTREAMLQ